MHRHCVNTKTRLKCYYMIIRSTFLHLMKLSLMRQFQNVTPKSMITIMNDMIVTDMVEVCVFTNLKSSINYEMVDVASHQDGLELISLEIKPKCAKSFILIAWYRPPKRNISSIHKIKDICQALDIRQKEIIILGDTNCDDLPDEDKNTVIKNLRAFYREFQMKQLIRNSTRVTNRSNTLLDHFPKIYCNFRGENNWFQ